jgi:hypothetical protein
MISIPTFVSNSHGCIPLLVSPFKNTDGFHVCELLKTTKDIITDLQDKVLDDVLPTHQKSIIQFYLRQIQSFNDVMADLGLFGLMQDILEMYEVIPRNKKGPNSKGGINSLAPPQAKVPEKEIEDEPEIVELDPDKKYNFRAEFSGGYVDPLSGTAPGPDENKGKNDPQKGSGGDEDFVIYFDMKTGTIGKIPRKDCASKGVIVSQTVHGEEALDGEIVDDDEREKLVWDMKRAMKNKKGDRTASKSPGANRKKYVIAPRKDATGRKIGRSKSGEIVNNMMRVPSLDATGRKIERSKSGENVNNMMRVPSLDKENNDLPSSQNVDATTVRKMSANSTLQTATQPPKRAFLQKKEPTNLPPVRTSSNQTASTSKRPTIQKVVKDPKPSNDGWSNATSMAATRRSK